MQSRSGANGDECPRAHFTFTTPVESLAKPHPDPVTAVSAGSFPPTSDKLSALLLLFVDHTFSSQHKCYNLIACKPDVACGCYSGSMQEEKVVCEKRKCFSWAGKVVSLLLRAQMQKYVPNFQRNRTVKIFIELRHRNSCVLIVSQYCIWNVFTWHKII